MYEAIFDKTHTPCVGADYGCGPDERLRECDYKFKVIIFRVVRKFRDHGE